jgi:hypothetical protein
VADATTAPVVDAPLETVVDSVMFVATAPSEFLRIRSASGNVFSVPLGYNCALTSKLPFCRRV